MCIDYRAVNRQTIPDAQPLPNIHTILDQLAGAEWFTSVDMVKGYYQMRLSPESQPVTSFAVPQRTTYAFKRLPFGLTNAPGQFSRMMNSLLSGLKGNISQAFLDDILVYSADFSTHLHDIQQVFNRLRDMNLKLSPSKSEFCKQTVTYLGYSISAAGISPSPEKIEKVANYPQPKDASGVRSFLGLVRYFNPLIEDLARTAKPLDRTTSTN